MSSKPKTKKENPTMQMNMPEGVKQMAEKSVDQAQAAFEKAGEVAHKNVQVLDASASAFKTNAADLQLKTPASTATAKTANVVVIIGLDKKIPQA